MSNRRQIFFFGPLPPPTHGMAVVNAQMIELMRQYGEIWVGNISPGGLARGIAYHARKMLRVFWALIRMPVARLSGCKTLYGSPDDNLGGIWTAALLLLARSMGMNVFLHHHSYRYLLKPTRLMRVITKLAGTSARHIVLGGDMANKLSSLYPAVQNVIVFENSVCVPENSAHRAASDYITVGLLANLTIEKGALEFIDSFDAMVGEGLLVRAILAGPVSDTAVGTAIRIACAKHGDKFVAAGPLHGPAKEQFFAEIDLFLFPTSYRTEAFPLVLMESLTRGVPVLAYRRGCIGALEGQLGVDLVEVGGDFVREATQAVRSMGKTNINRDDIAQAALARNTANLTQLDTLAAEICGGQGLRA
ncbi:glycosyltransferase family 4 protein [Sphingorhabdus contaminans]|uniref:glycosyltransferase family 4 protein n=1 Tax=Sphingorhabdus contaminans TaxID=1343899 RepID=UPI003D283D26